MLPESARKNIGRKVDQLVLLAMNQQIPDSLEQTYEASFSFEEVLEKTAIDRQKTAVYAVTAPGEHPIWLKTALGEILCHVKTRPALSPHAPLLLYHHGLAESPYTSTWSHLIPKDNPFPAHYVCVQAPYHNNIFEPFKVGFSSVQHIYQMFAGSLRVIEVVQEQFENEGAAFTTASGMSWGGITSVLYEGLFQSTRATVPMFSSPNLAQVMWDSAERHNRKLSVSRQTIDELFDFTPYYENCETSRIFPVLGEDDLFFRYEAHAPLFQNESLITLPSAHVGAMWRTNEKLRERLLEVLLWAAKNPR